MRPLRVIPECQDEAAADLLFSPSISRSASNQSWVGSPVPRPCSYNSNARRRIFSWISAAVSLGLGEGGGAGVTAGCFAMEGTTASPAGAEADPSWLRGRMILAGRRSPRSDSATSCLIISPFSAFSAFRGFLAVILTQPTNPARTSRTPMKRMLIIYAIFPRARSADLTRGDCELSGPTGRRLRRSLFCPHLFLGFAGIDKSRSSPSSSPYGSHGRSGSSR